MCKWYIFVFMCQMVIVLLMGHVTVNNLTLNIRHSIVQKIYFEFASGFRTALKTIHFNRCRILKIVNNTISEFFIVMLQIDHKNRQKWTNMVRRFLRLWIRAPLDVDVLVVLDVQVPRSFAFSHRGRSSFCPWSSCLVSKEF